MNLPTITKQQSCLCAEKLRLLSNITCIPNNTPTTSTRPHSLLEIGTEVANHFSYNTITMSSANEDPISLSLTHHAATHTFTFPPTATISDLSNHVADTLLIPPSNQKYLISKLGLLKPPFKDPALALTSLASAKITLMGSTATEANTITQASHDASRLVSQPAAAQKQKVKAYKTHDWKKEQEESKYTFLELRPLPYLPNPSRSLAFLQRLKDDVGIKAAMRKHKFTVPLLTEMNPIEHTQSNHEGTTRTLGLNRGAGEVIELRLRTDAYDGYRDYKTIRNTLCHELAHNVWGPHDRNFWELCKKIEKEVEGADWKSGGRAVAEGEEFYEGGGEVADHGGWSGGEFVLGSGGGGGGSGSAGGQATGQAAGRREAAARAAEERLKRMREESGRGDQGSGSG